MAEGLTQLLRRALAQRLRAWADDVLDEAPAPIARPPSGTATASAAPSRQDDAPSAGDSAGDGAPRIWLDYVRERAPHLIVDGRFMASRRGEPAPELPPRMSWTLDAPRARHDLARPRRQEVEAKLEPPADTRRIAGAPSGSPARPRAPQRPEAAEIVDWPRRRGTAVAIADRFKASSPKPASVQGPIHPSDQGVEGPTVPGRSVAHGRPRVAFPEPPVAAAVPPPAALGEVSGAASRVRPALSPAAEPEARPTTRPTTRRSEAAPRDQHRPAAVSPKDVSRPSIPHALPAFDRVEASEPSPEPRDLWPTLPYRAPADPRALAHDLESRARRARLRREQMGEP